jgi:transposase InsO family protein
LKEKSEAFEVFKKFKVMVEKAADRHIKDVRSDRGGEYTSTAFMKYCEEQGIRRFLTAPYSPQQNGVAERKNRTVLDMVRSMLKSKNMSTFEVRRSNTTRSIEQSKANSFSSQSIW